MKLFIMHFHNQRPLSQYVINRRSDQLSLICKLFFYVIFICLTKNKISLYFGILLMAIFCLQQWTKNFVREENLMTFVLDYQPTRTKPPLCQFLPCGFPHRRFSTNGGGKRIIGGFFLLPGLCCYSADVRNF